jgi:hypothetical protein
MDDLAQAVAEARALLERFGLLLLSDPALPSLVGLIVGEPLHRSWLGHPRGHLIYAALNVLEDDPEILSTKLVAGKVTYVHRRLWPAIYAIGTARASWQLDTLSRGAAWLLGLVDDEEELQTDLVVPPADLGRIRVPDAARELERRLLVHAMEVHTPSGAHAKVLQRWSRWAQELGFRASEIASAAAYARVEDAATRLAAKTPGAAELPWRPSGRNRARGRIAEPD